MQRELGNPPRPKAWGTAAVPSAGHAHVLPGQGRRGGGGGSAQTPPIRAPDGLPRGARTRCRLSSEKANSKAGHKPGASSFPAFPGGRSSSRRQHCACVLTGCAGTGHFLSSLGEQGKTVARVPGSLHPRGAVRSFWLQPSAWPSPGCCGCLGGDPSRVQASSAPAFTQSRVARHRPRPSSCPRCYF